MSNCSCSNHGLLSTGINGKINLKKVPAFKCGLWHSDVCINDQTTNFHTENDCIYTLITVPKQEIIKNECLKREYQFLFKLNGYQNIAIKLVYGVTILFSGNFLTHRQYCNRPSLPMDDVFFNFASYGSEKLYRHIRKSFIRKQGII